jgi:integrase
VEPTGAKAFKAIYSRHGQPRWLNIGKTGAIGLADARKLAAKTMAAAAEGKDPAAEKKAERASGTFADLAVRYVEEYAKKNNKSWEQAAYLIRSYVVPYWSKLQAKSISRADVKALMRRLDNRPALANQVLAAISAIFTWAEGEEILPGPNPCKLVARNETRSRERVLSETELPMVWAALGDSLQGRALKALLLLGQRPGEVSCMRREHIRDGWWEMPGKPMPELKWPGTKNGQSHRVWLPKPVRAIIDRKETGFVFGQRGRPVLGLDTMMRAISKQLGIEPVRPHDLRRTHGTTITKLKFGREAMNRIQNHKEGGISDVYDVHEYADENKHIMETVAAHILALAEGKPEESNVVQMGARR